MVAWRKIVRYIFIPFLAILLMSHNSYALELTQDVDSVYSWKNPQIWCMVFGGSLYSNGSDTCIVGPNTGTAWQGSGVSYIKTANINLVQNDYYQVFLDVSMSNGAESHIPVVWNLGTTANYDIVSFKQVSESNNLGSSASNEAYVVTYEIILKGLYNNSSFPIELGYPAGDINMIYLAGDFYTSNMDVRVSRVNQYHPRSALSNSDVVNAINNLTNNTPSASDIGEAVNAPEEEAASNIENQSTSDVDTGDTSSAMSIIGNMQNIVGIIEDVPLREDCVIVGNLGNINLGNINFCSGRSNLSTVADFGNAVFAFTTTLAGSIYLIRKTLKLIDWARGD